MQDLPRKGVFPLIFVPELTSHADGITSKSPIGFRSVS
jgi:hypothetical protein